MTQNEKARNALAKTKLRPMSKPVAEIRQNINLIHEALKSVMKENVHFGIIPGCKKNSLYKPGAEVIMSLFRLSSDPEVKDLSENGEIRYQVKVRIATRDGAFVGNGIGECSSGEEKYMWRAALCDEEFDSFQETMRRIKFKKDNYRGTIEQIKQVRVSPADLANTILKMAKKRALIDGVLTATAASDIFTQDIEDIPAEFIDDEAKPAPAATAKPPEQPKAEDPNKEQSWDNEEQQEAPATPPPAEPARVITDKQGKRLFAISKGSGYEISEVKEWVKDMYGYEHLRDIQPKDYEDICAHFQIQK